MTLRRPTSVAILWHMHQPWYADARSGRMNLPWTRLHALKDYLDMIALVEEYPEAHVTFNLVPSLLAQLQLYVAGQTTDDTIELSRRPAADLTPDERRWWMSGGFQCHWPRMVEPYPRYRELLALRGTSNRPERLEAAAERFTAADLRDLQVWLNLTWCGVELRRSEPVVAELLKKGSGYSEEDKQALLDCLDRALATVIPRYVEAARRGHVELATSPYYHPILPLLCHYQDARVAMPGVRMPAGFEDLPEDAAAQLRAGRELCRDLLGFEPVGLWPSEGSVSNSALERVAEAGFRWVATDEQILFNSLRRGGSVAPGPGDLFQPYAHGQLAIFFRERRVSDRIGFDYATWRPEAAVADLIAHLERAAATASGVDRPVISVILDGENCWEFYANNGHDFLAGLYRELVRHPYLTPVTFSEHLDAAPPAETLPDIFPGSWINADFYIWAGHREDQRAWELLFLTRRALVQKQDDLEADVRARAWEHIYIAEGSDWFWWYGDDHSSADDETFDLQFRTHLLAVFEILGEEPPKLLFEPVSGLAAATPLTLPVAPFTPHIDGRQSDFFEWRAAGRLEGRGPAGAMRRGGEQAVFTRVRYGFDQESIHLAIELDPTTLGSGEAPSVVVEWTAGGQTTRLEVVYEPMEQSRRVAVSGPTAASAKVAIDKMIELSLPRVALPAEAGAAVEMVVEISRGGDLLDRWPVRGAFDVPIPGERDWMRDWLV